jgi:glutamate carboxypeptidase
VAHLAVEGRASHAGAAPKEGRNALIELAYQLLQTRDLDKAVPDTQLNWTVAQAGVVNNQIPPNAHAEGDIRAKSAEGIDRIEAALRKKIGESSLVPDTKVTLRMERGHPTFIASPQSHALANKANDIYGEVGQTLSFRVFTGGSTDASWAALSGKAVVLESFGLAGAGYHGKDEHVVLDSIVPRLYLATRILQEIGQNWDTIARR